jgi:hypothetical protein
MSLAFPAGLFLCRHNNAFHEESLELNISQKKWTTHIDKQSEYPCWDDQFNFGWDYARWNVIR